MVHVPRLRNTSALDRSDHRRCLAAHQVILAGVCGGVGVMGGPMAVLVSGAAGFIGYHTCAALLERGDAVIGIDNMNDYYDPVLKQTRLQRLQEQSGFRFRQLDIADREAMERLMEAHPEIERIVHLAAQAGVRHSFVDPFAYVDSNVMGQLVVIEAARRLPRLDHVVYASSSSVYGGNQKLPFALDDPVDQPVSLYAATKRAAELIAQCHAHLYRIPMTGLRFFTVYGPWGRPDMSAYLFTKAIFEGDPITIFNHGDMKRDFSYIDDVVAGVVAALDRPPAVDGPAPPHRLYNLGNHRSEGLMRFIEVLERACGRSAV